MKPNNLISNDGKVKKKTSTSAKNTAIPLALLPLAACGGEGGNSPTTPTPAPPPPIPDFTETSTNVFTARDDNDRVLDQSAATADLTVVGKGGNDTITTGSGADNIDGGAGDDTIKGGAGNDIIKGGAGSDHLYGGLGKDTLIGGGGDADHFYLNLSDGDIEDTFEGASGFRSYLVIYGNDNQDYTVNLADVNGKNITNISLQEGNITVHFNIENLKGFNSIDNKFSFRGNEGDSLSTDWTGWEITRFTSNPFVVTGFSLAKDGYSLFVDIEIFLKGYQESLNHFFEETNLTYKAFGNSNSTFYMPTSSDNLSVYAHDGDDYIIVGSGDDYIFSGKGDDTLIGGAGDDDIRGWFGNDELIGGSGNDKLSGHDGNDTLLGQDGDDILYGGKGDDTIKGGNGADQIYGGPGIDFISLTYGDDSVTFDYIDGGQDFDIVLMNEVLNLSDVNMLNIEKIIIWTDGAITFNADDIIKVTDYENKLILNTEQSKAYGPSSNAVGNWVFETVEFIAYPYIDYSYFHQQPLYIYTDGGATIAVAGNFDNLPIPNIGFYKLDADNYSAVDDTNSVLGLVNAENNLTVAGKGGDDIIFTGSGDDIIKGGAGNDTIYGGKGVDTLNGGLGDDILFYGDYGSASSYDGGEGIDSFHFSTSFAVPNDGLAVLTVTNIEIIDILEWDGRHFDLSLQDVLNVTDDNNQLIIKGDMDNYVNSTSQNWVLGADQIIDGELYHTYTSGSATLLVDTDITQAGIT